MTGARTRFQRRRGCGFTGAVGGAGAALPLSRPAARRSFLVLLPERAAAAPKPLLGPPRGGVRGARVGSSASAARRLGVCVPRGPAPGSRLPPPGRPAAPQLPRSRAPGAAPLGPYHPRARRGAPAEAGPRKRTAQLPSPPPAFAPQWSRPRCGGRGLAAVTSEATTGRGPGRRQRFLPASRFSESAHAGCPSFPVYFFILLLRLNGVGDTGSQRSSASYCNKKNPKTNF